MADDRSDDNNDKLSEEIRARAATMSTAIQGILNIDRQPSDAEVRALAAKMQREEDEARSAKGKGKGKGKGKAASTSTGPAVGSKEWKDQVSKEQRARAAAYVKVFKSLKSEPSEREVRALAERLDREEADVRGGWVDDDGEDDEDEEDEEEEDFVRSKSPAKSTRVSLLEVRVGTHL